MALSANTAKQASLAVAVSVALAVPAFIVFGRSALGIALALALLALGAALAAGVRWPLWPHPARLPLLLAAVIVVAWLPSLVVSIDRWASLLTLLRTLATLGAGIVLIGFLVRQDTELTIRIFIIGMVAALAFAVLALYVHPQLLGFRSKVSATPHLQLKASASAIACALPLLAYFGWRLGFRWRGAACVGVLLGFAVMFGTSSRSSLAGVLVASGLAAMVFLLRPRRPFLTIVSLLGGGGALAGMILAVPTLAPQEAIGGYELFAPDWLVDRHRQVIWQFTLDRFAEHPWFGWGLNVINQAPGAGDQIPELGAEYIPSHPHNWMIETLAETGVTGFVPLLIVVLGVAVAAARAFWSGAGVGWLTWLAVWLTYWSAGAFNFSMWNASWQASGMILAVLICSEADRPKEAVVTQVGDLTNVR